MFDGIRDKFFSLQENLTSTLRGLSVGDALTRKQVVKPSCSVNLNAGTDLLDKFQSSWSELHEASQENANKAQEVDSLIWKMHRNVQKQWNDIGNLAKALTSLSEVVSSVNRLNEKIVGLESLFDSVEKSLIQLEDILDTEEFQNKQLEHRFQLALHEEKKLTMLENVRLRLSDELAEKVKRHEMREHQFLKEYQEASEENFKEDLKVYKETNTLPKIEFAKSKNKTGEEGSEINKLEDVILDNSSTALDEFLNDSKDSEQDKEGD